MADKFTVYISDYLRDVEYTLECTKIVLCNITQWVVFRDVMSVKGDETQSKSKPRDLWVPIDMIAKVEVVENGIATITPLRTIQ